MQQQFSMSADQNDGNEKMAPKNDPNTATDQTNIDDSDLQEMQDVNNSLDELSSALDFFEQRTDNIIEQLKELLHSNREIRQQLAVENAAAAAHGDSSEPKTN